MKKEIGLYIHVPFCKSKCYYCDFVSYANKASCMGKYIKAIIKEIKYMDMCKYNVKTIYIGGGTPSILDSKYILQMLDELRKYTDSNAEVTIEVNPGTVDIQKIEEYKHAGINRISIGLQSTDNEILKQIGRIHNYEDFLKTYENARKIGIKNINVDLMLGLPNQTIEILEDSVKKIIEIQPEHISIYSLILEEGTKLYNIVANGKVNLPNEDVKRKMYGKVKKI